MNVQLERLTKRSCTETWTRWLNNRETTRYLESKGPWGVVRLREWFDAQEAAGARLYGIEANGTWVGTLKLQALGPECWTNVGLMIGVRTHRRCGIGSQAIISAVALCDKVGALGVWAGMRVDNVGSARAFAKAGFRVAAERSTEGDRYHRMGDIPGVVLDAVTHWPTSPARVAVMRRLRNVVPPPWREEA